MNIDEPIDKYIDSSKAKSKQNSNKKTRAVINNLKNSEFVKLIVLSKNLENTNTLEYIVLVIT